jgi:hypothetical protein
MGVDAATALGQTVETLNIKASRKGAVAPPVFRFVPLRFVVHEKPGLRCSPVF